MGDINLTPPPILLSLSYGDPRGLIFCRTLLLSRGFQLAPESVLKVKTAFLIKEYLTSYKVKYFVTR
jgi:hypothetical protein